jgi:hypothetical protein
MNDEKKEWEPVRAGVETMSTPGGFVRATGTEAEVCKLIARRQALGVNKYGTTVRDNVLTLRQWLVHQQEELADALVYCTRAIEELDRANEECGK